MAGVCLRRIGRIPGVGASVPRPGPALAGLHTGGRQPRWNRNGKEVFYRDGNKMMVVEVSARPDLVLSPPRLLFDQRYAFGIGVTTPTTTSASISVSSW